MVLDESSCFSLLLLFDGVDVANGFGLITDGCHFDRPEGDSVVFSNSIPSPADLMRATSPLSKSKV